MVLPKAPQGAGREVSAMGQEGERKGGAPMACVVRGVFGAACSAAAASQ
jgi:hypothetical protein